MTVSSEIENKKNKLYPFVFKPNLHTIVWGGSRLKPWKQIPDNDVPIGESWEVSAVPSSPSIIDNGCWAGMSLIDVINQMPNEILGRAVAQKYGNKLPLLVKFIDADKDLSIQVHPDDKMALREHNKFGKTEMWYVIDAKPGAYLYAGFKDKLTPEEFCDLIKSSSNPSFRDSSHPSNHRDITSVLARHEVHTGDVFYIPAGRVHAIGGGILLAEVQQSSDVTYRIYDYNRLDIDGRLRELHTELASKALDYEVHDEYRTIYRHGSSFFKIEGGRGSANRVINSEFFNVRVVEIDKRFHRNLLKYDSFIITMCIKGSCHIKIRSTQDEVVLHEGNSCLIPAAIADYDVEPIEGHSLLLDAFIDNRKCENTSENKEKALHKLLRFLHIK